MHIRASESRRYPGNDEPVESRLERSSCQSFFAFAHLNSNDILEFEKKQAPWIPVYETISKVHHVAFLGVLAAFGLSTMYAPIWVTFGIVPAGAICLVISGVYFDHKIISLKRHHDELLYTDGMLREPSAKALHPYGPYDIEEDSRFRSEGMWKKILEKLNGKKPKKSPGQVERLVQTHGVDEAPFASIDEDPFVARTAVTGLTEDGELTREWRRYGAQVKTARNWLRGDRADAGFGRAKFWGILKEVKQTALHVVSPLLKPEFALRNDDMPPTNEVEAMVSRLAFLFQICREAHKLHDELERLNSPDAANPQNDPFVAAGEDWLRNIGVETDFIKAKGSDPDFDERSLAFINNLREIGEDLRWYSPHEKKEAFGDVEREIGRAAQQKLRFKNQIQRHPAMRVRQYDKWLADLDKKILSSKALEEIQAHLRDGASRLSQKTLDEIREWKEQHPYHRKLSLRELYRCNLVMRRALGDAVEEILGLSLFEDPNAAQLDDFERNTLRPAKKLIVDYVGETIAMERFLHYFFTGGAAPPPMPYERQPDLITRLSEIYTQCEREDLAAKLEGMTERKLYGKRGYELHKELFVENKQLIADLEKGDEVDREVGMKLKKIQEQLEQPYLRKIEQIRCNIEEELRHLDQKRLWVNRVRNYGIETILAISVIAVAIIYFTTVSRWFEFGLLLEIGVLGIASVAVNSYLRRLENQWQAKKYELQYPTMDIKRAPGTRPSLQEIDRCAKIYGLDGLARTQAKILAPDGDQLLQFKQRRNVESSLEIKKQEIEERLDDPEDAILQASKAKELLIAINYIDEELKEYNVEALDIEYDRSKSILRQGWYINEDQERIFLSDDEEERDRIIERLEEIEGEKRALVNYHTLIKERNQYYEEYQNLLPVQLERIEREIRDREFKKLDQESDLLWNEQKIMLDAKKTAGIVRRKILNKNVWETRYGTASELRRQMWELSRNGEAGSDRYRGLQAQLTEIERITKQSKKLEERFGTVEALGRTIQGFGRSVDFFDEEISAKLERLQEIKERNKIFPYAEAPV